MNNKAFWQKQARNYMTDIKAVNFDPLTEDLEMFYLKDLVGQNEMVCDLGCGNGRVSLFWAEKYPNSRFYGMDYIPEMIDAANMEKRKRGLGNVEFITFDATSKKVKDLYKIRFDKVLSKRLLINLRKGKKQQAIDNIHALLKDNGTYIMVECFEKPLRIINKIRIGIELETIGVRHFNEYLSDLFLEDISDRFYVDRKIDFNSLYYFISRVFNAKLSSDSPDYYSNINKLAVELTKDGLADFEGLSPEIIYLLKKRT